MNEKTLRDEFAMAALAGLIAEPRSENGSTAWYLAGRPTGVDFAKTCAIAAYRIADAMLREREKEQK